ncbi:hypothetical protein PBY51_019726 [Eleginops maclovinus]|uniref:Uncharacterized protein n=2 Tax=Eleginops maclovinus TaxID=56733 RepID=A0AAN7XL35_ELEMC|nr:hypothetical protein PBY51_019726 [Eleginops maclovinus]
MQWQQKFDTAVIQRDSLENEQKKLNEDVQFFQDKLKSHGEFKKSYEAVEVAKKTLTSENRALQEKLNDLRKKCPVDEQEEVQARNRDLKRQVQENQDLINGYYRDNDTLCDETLELMITVQENRAQWAKH